MNKSKFLIIVSGLFWAVAPCLQSTLWAEHPQSEPTKQAIEKEGLKEQKKDKFANYPEHIKTNYYCILKNIQESNKDYVGRGRKIGSSMEDSIKKYGIKKIVGIRNKAHTSCLDLALERINHEMPKKDFDKKTKEISKQYYDGIQETNVSAPVNFKKSRIIHAAQKKVRLDVLLNEKLLTSELKIKDEGDYKKLVQAAFSEKEYLEVIAKRISAIDGIYDAFIKSRVGLTGMFATSGINKMRAFAIQYYKAEPKKIYPKKGGKDSSDKKQTPDKQKACKEKE